MKYDYSFEYLSGLALLRLIPKVEEAIREEWESLLVRAELENLVNALRAQLQRVSRGE